MLYYNYEQKEFQRSLGILHIYKGLIRTTSTNSLTNLFEKVQRSCLIRHMSAYIDAILFLCQCFSFPLLCIK